MINVNVKVRETISSRISRKMP